MSRFVLLSASTRRRAAGLAVATSLTLVPSLADAHFNLQAPPNWTTETPQGSPQKDWPCGNEDDPAATGPTTPFKPGDKVTIKLAETVTHPGYYRVALATSGDMMDLPPDMSRAESGDTCENDDKQAAPVFPILADGMLEHTAKLNGVQSFDVTLPSDVTCDKCVLQVREYMQGHPSAPETPTQTNGCYYHHCAFISITAAGTGGTSGSGGAPNGGAPNSGGGASGMSGTAGASMGGAMGEGGRLMSAGGAPAAAGASSSGHAGTGAAGMPATGGAPSGTGGSAVPGAGGSSTVSGAGGATASTTGGSAGSLASSNGGMKSGPVTPPADSDNEGGCAVSVHGGARQFGFAGALGLGIWLARRRRR